MVLVAIHHGNREPVATSAHD